MARSRTSGRRTAGRHPQPSPDASASAVDTVATPTIASATLPRVWQGVGYRPLADVSAARSLFDYMAIAWPPGDAPEPSWAAYTRETGAEVLIGAAIGEHAGANAMLHGPAISTQDNALEVATQLVAAWLDHAVALGIETVFARPNGLDRVWVRFGFIPVPEGALPRALAGRPGAGLFAWRGGSALWSFRETPRD